MPIYHVKRAADANGYCIGILLLEAQQAFIPGDVGNATSYDFPVLYRTVPGAVSTRVFAGDTELEESVVSTALELQAQGVKGISSDCGFFLNYQDRVREALDIPVFLSSMLQLPLVSSLLGRDKSIGILTANANALGNHTLALTNLEAERQTVIRGMQDNEHWHTAFKDPGLAVDSDLIEKEVVATALEMQVSSPNLGAIVLECSMMPPYSHAIQQATGLPVFDFLTLINLYQRVTHQSPYHGYY